MSSALEPTASAPAAPVAAGAPPKAMETVSDSSPDYLALAREFKVKEDLVKILFEALGAELDVDIEDLLAIPQALVDNTLTNLKKTVDGTPTALSPLESGSVAKYMTKLRTRFAPSTGVPSAPSLAPPASAPAPPETGTKRKISEVVDQMDDRPFDVPDADECRRLRENFKKVCGGKPSEQETPTAEQMGALKAKMDKRSAPYCDFAIFGPNGRRMSKIRRFEAQVFVDNELRQKVLRGPSDFRAWTDSWRVFRTAMISLKAAAPQTLDDYFRGIEQLTVLYPHAWGLIFCADELMRSEGWDKIREELEDDREWPENLPWNKVIQMSTYGRGDPDRQHWWFTHVIAPATTGGGGRATVAQLDGCAHLPAEDGLFGQGSNRTDAKPRGRRAGRGAVVRNNVPNAAPHGKFMGQGKGGYHQDNWDHGKAKGKGNKNKGKNHGKNMKGGKGKATEPTK